MINKILKLIFPVGYIRYRAYKLLIVKQNSYLYSQGWLESIKRGYPCRKDGAALPWMNYSIISFLEKRFKSNFSLFEYGCGYSTLFYSRYVKSVTSVEHDASWYESIKGMVPCNVKLIFKEGDHDGDYCRSVKQEGNQYDVIIIDGRDRVNCVKQSIESLSSGGVIMLDDSGRKRYVDGINWAREKGFLELDFEGLKPTGSGLDKTTIFYRKHNCFNI
ncbi:MAG: FkbM family methyltransferase [Pseudomonadota bacterium]